MYKSQLQELCQKKSWSLPVYESVKDGPGHQPFFTATVTVNDTTFESPIQCRSSKEAQNAAAQVAFNNFSSLPPALQQQSMISLVQKYAPSGSLPSTTNLDTKTAKSREAEQKKDGLLLAEISTNIEEDLLHTYKNRLQIYAQKRNLILPTYTCETIGLPHERLYKCKVTVDGNSFETPNHFSTLKDAEHGAAKVAFESMSLDLTEEDKVLYKTLLQEHAQRKGLRFPIYDTQRSGPLHTPLFVSKVEIGDKSFQGQEAKTKKMAEMNAAKAAYICLTKLPEKEVTVDGNSFETPNHFSTLKDAEHGAAKVAFESMSLPLTEEDKVLYKSLLQEHAQRKGLRFPIYDTQRSGPLHTPLFVSRVEIGDKSFQGQEAKTKKMAEMNAAKAAYICLTKCQKSQSSNYSAGETSEVSSFNLQPNVTGKVEEAVARKSNSQSSNFSGGKTLEVSTVNLQPDVRGMVEDVARKNNIVSKEQTQEIQDNNAKRHRNSTTSEDTHARERGSSIAKSPPQDSKDGASLPTLDIIIPPAQASVKRILVSPRTPNMIIPEGATILPSSNDQWVAVAMTVPEEEYEKYYN